jgi:hypothetical protein
LFETSREQHFFVIVLYHQHIYRQCHSCCERTCLRVTIPPSPTWPLPVGCYSGRQCHSCSQQSCLHATPLPISSLLLASAADAAPEPALTEEGLPPPPHAPPPPYRHIRSMKGANLVSAVVSCQVSAAAAAPRPAISRRGRQPHPLPLLLHPLEHASPQAPPCRHRCRLLSLLLSRRRCPLLLPLLCCCCCACPSGLP